MKINTSKLMFLLGLAWGCGNIFAELFGQLQLIQMVTVLVVVIFFLLLDNNSIWAWTRYELGLLIAIHVVSATISWAISGCNDMYIVRYAILLPVISIILYINKQEKAMFGYVSGVISASLIYLLYTLTYVDIKEIFNPLYRIETPIGLPNGIAFIVAIPTVFLIWYIFRCVDRFQKSAIIIIVFFGLAIVIASKSRTALFSLAVASLYIFWINMKRSVSKGMMIGVSAIAFLALAFTVLSFSNVLIHKSIEVLSLDDQYRGIDTGSNRYEIWAYVVRNVWLPNFFFGVGPGNHYEMVAKGTSFGSAENGLLINLSEIGIVGTIPLIVIITSCFKKLIREEKIRHSWAAPIFIAGVAESLAEIMFFSTGNTSSMMFLSSVVYIMANRGDGK